MGQVTTSYGNNWRNLEISALSTILTLRNLSYSHLKIVGRKTPANSHHPNFPALEGSSSGPLATFVGKCGRRTEGPPGLLMAGFLTSSLSSLGLARGSVSPSTLSLFAIVKISCRSESSKY